MRGRVVDMLRKCGRAMHFCQQQLFCCSDELRSESTCPPAWDLRASSLETAAGLISYVLLTGFLGHPHF